MKWSIKLIAIAIIAISVIVTTCTSCTSQRQMNNLIAQHTLELHEVNTQLSTANEELVRQTAMLDSLMGLPEQIREVIITQDRIIDNTDSLVVINNQMLRRLHKIENNTDTILDILRTKGTFEFQDTF